METVDMLGMLLVLGAINHQITHIITTGVIFQEIRQWVWNTFGGKLGYLVTCHLCCGTWIGYIMAVFAIDAITLDDRMMINYLLVAFAISLVGRVWNELIAILSSKVAEIRKRESCYACGQ
jgi:hypothetical protein